MQPSKDRRTLKGPWVDLVHYLYITVFRYTNQTLDNPGLGFRYRAMFFNRNNVANFIFVVFIVRLVFFIVLHEFSIQRMTKAAFYFDNNRFIICCTSNRSLQYTSWHNTIPYILFLFLLPNLVYNNLKFGNLNQN